MKTPAPETSARPPLPVWSIPLLLAMLGILLFIGHLSDVLRALAGAEVVFFCLYILWRSRHERARVPGMANLLSLFPGHLLLLFGISLIETPDGLAAIWLVIPILSIAYEETGSRMSGGWVRTSILIGAYAILWAVLFALLERLIAVGRALDPRAEIIAASAIGVFGFLFIALGIYRHVRAGKE